MYVVRSEPEFRSSMATKVHLSYTFICPRLMSTTRMGTVGGVSPGEGGTTRSDSRTELTEDELFGMLANSRRRYILHALAREERPVEIGELSTEIAAREDDVSVAEVTSKDRKRVYTALQQSHLPKMDETGVVDFDKDRGTVEPTPTLEDVEVYIDVVRGREIPWSDYYLGLSVLVAVTLGGAGLGVAPFTAVPEMAWITFAVVTLTFSAVAHRIYAKRSRLGIEGDHVEFDEGTV